MNVKTFKRKYPRQYQYIVNKYGQKISNGGYIHDLQAAIFLYVNNLPHPTCEICCKKVIISKRFRERAPNRPRCAAHVNTNKIYTIDDIKEKNVNNYLITGVEDPIIVNNTYLNLFCEKHNHSYRQQVKNFIKGMQCQKCYADNRAARITKTEWLNKCNTIHNNKYDYSKVSFGSISDDVIIICPEHGEFAQNAGVHSHGHGCKECSYNTTYSRDYFIKKSAEQHDNKYLYDKAVYTGSREPITITCPTHGEFEQVAYYHLAGHGCPKCGAASTSFQSKAEFEIIDFLKEHNIRYIHGYQDLGVEIDIFLPEYNIGIEYNGIYWHSSNNIKDDHKFSKKHLIKTEICERNNIRLFHILDIEWNDLVKKEIWKSMLLVNCKRATRVFARKCQVNPITSKEAKCFFNKTHLQGFCSAAEYIGLFYNNQLCCAISIRKPRFNTFAQLEIIRMSSALNTTVVGGIGKLISYIQNRHPNSFILSYANRRWSYGNVYQKINFELENVCDPCYYYTDTKKLWHRASFTKSKLSSKLTYFNPKLTEVENMYNNSYRRIWDCGHYRYMLKPKRRNHFEN